MFNKKMKAWLAVGALAAVLAVSGCGGNGDKAKSGDAAKSGVPSIVRVGAETTFPPFEFTKDDKYVGFDLDLAEAVIKQMGSKMEFKSMGFDALIPAVQSGQIDMIASGLSANPEREKQVAFSDVYFDKNKSIKKLEDIFGRELKKIKEEFSFCQKIDFSLKTGVIKKNITEVELKFLENEISIYENNFKVNLEMRECDE